MNESPKLEIDFNTIKRLWHYIKQGNKAKIILVISCIIINTIAVVAGSLYLQVLIDNYITPLIRNTKYNAYKFNSANWSNDWNLYSCNFDYIYLY